LAGANYIIRARLPDLINNLQPDAELHSWRLQPAIKAPEYNTCPNQKDYNIHCSENRSQNKGSWISASQPMQEAHSKEPHTFLLLADRTAGML
jgi:hypothetical protein